MHPRQTSIEPSRKAHFIAFQRNYDFIFYALRSATKLSILTLIGHWQEKILTTQKMTILCFSGAVSSARDQKWVQRQ